MKFTTATIFKIDAMFDLPGADAVEDNLKKSSFAPCGPTQEKSVGWAPPREKGGPLLEAIDGHWLLCLRIETKAVPAAVLNDEVDERAAAIERETGRNPGRKERKVLKQDVYLEFLPRAFPRESTIQVWIDRKRGTIVLDNASPSKTDEAITSLVESIPGLSVRPLCATIQPSTAMAEWLVSDAPDGFSINRAAVLNATDDSKAKVGYTNRPLDTDDVRENIQQGMRPSRLALTWQDRVSFVLCESGTITGIKMLDGILQSDGDAEAKADRFDGDVALATGELGGLIEDLIGVLGDQYQRTIGEGS